MSSIWLRWMDSNEHVKIRLELNHQLMWLPLSYGTPIFIFTLHAFNVGTDPSKIQSENITLACQRS